MKTKRIILHITTHMGGGVGKVLSGVASYAVEHECFYQHRILLLEKPEKMNFIEDAHSHGVYISIATCREEIEAAIIAADIVQMEWWHHPLMAAFLTDFPQVAMRLVIWSHISGCYYPCLPEAFLRVPMKFVFTSSYSFENPYWSSDGRDWAEDHCAMVNSSGGFESIHAVRQMHDRFTIGYIGTQSYAKLHPDFVRYCKEACVVSDVQFTMVGDKTNAVNILEDAKKIGIQDKFCFVDYVSQVDQEFAKMDVFGYLLNPVHFGTTENVLLEAMAAALPVVCLDQCAEKYLIQPGVTGILVHDSEEYRCAIQWLYDHPEERRRMGDNARSYVLQKYSVTATVHGLEQIYDDMIQQKKCRYQFKDIFGQKPYEYFLACLPGSLREEFEANQCHGRPLHPWEWPIILKEKSKSSLQQFCKIYPDDPVLLDWKKCMLETIRTGVS